MEEGEEGAEGAAKEDDVVAVADGARERAFVGVKTEEDAVEDGVAGLIGNFEVAVEFKEFGIQGKDECEGDLGLLN